VSSNVTFEQASPSTGAYFPTKTPISEETAEPSSSSVEPSAVTAIPYEQTEEYQRNFFLLKVIMEN